jgi:hypothetical protein
LPPRSDSARARDPNRLADVARPAGARGRRLPEAEADADVVRALEHAAPVP